MVCVAAFLAVLTHSNSPAQRLCCWCPFISCCGVSVVQPMPSNMYCKAPQEALSTPLFIAFLRDDQSLVVAAREVPQRVTLIHSLFSCYNEVGMVQSFTSEQLARECLSEPVVSPWVAGLSLGSLAVSPAAASEGSKSSSSGDICEYSCIMPTTGGFVARKSQKLNVVQLLKTLSFLKGEQNLASSASSEFSATSWIELPVLFRFLSVLLTRRHLTALPRVSMLSHGIFMYSDSDSTSVDELSSACRSSGATIQSGTPPNVPAIAAALPSPPAPTCILFSMQYMRKGMALPVGAPLPVLHNDALVCPAGRYQPSSPIRVRSARSRLSRARWDDGGVRRVSDTGVFTGMSASP